MLWVVLGAGLLIVAVVGAVVGARKWPLWNALRRVSPTTPERLAQAARDGHLDGRVVAVSGLDGAGASGPLRSAVNDEPCVWHRHVVHTRQISYRTSKGATSRRYSRRRKVADVATRDGFLLRGLLVQPTTAARERVGAGAGRVPSGETAPGVEIRPEGLRIHRPIGRHIKILPGLASEPFPPAEALMGRVAQLFWHREWLLRAGAPLFVLAEVHTSGPRLVLRRPARGPHVISTHGARSLRLRAFCSVVVGFGLAAFGGIAGACLLLVYRF
jgi:hypothetical protein